MPWRASSGLAHLFDQGRSACELRSFDGIDDREMVTGGERFTVDAAGTRSILDFGGTQFERSLGVEIDDRIPIQIGDVLATRFLSLAPEGDLLFHTHPAEPMRIEVATRAADGSWVAVDRTPPKGAVAGVPSALEFGPRRVIVRTRQVGSGILEYEDDGASWVPIGEEQVERNGVLSNSTGFPALAFPGGFSKPTADAPIGVPIGLELLGPEWSEPTLFKLAYAFEQRAQVRRPPRSTPPLK